MDLLSDPDLLPLLERSTEGELEIHGGIGRLRIDLKQDDIRLWQDTLITIIDQVKAGNPDLQVRVSFVGYRDFCDGDKRFNTMDFTEDLAKVKKYIAE